VVRAKWVVGEGRYAQDAKGKSAPPVGFISANQLR
jgi:hypothetical protein